MDARLIAISPEPFSRGIKNKDKQSCNSCMRHSTLTWPIILPSTTKIFVTVVELCSGNQSEEKIWTELENEDKQSCHSCV